MITEMSTQISDEEKIPNRRNGWGFSLRLDIEVYLDILELIHATAGGEGVEVLFRVLNRDCEGSESLVIP